MIQPLTSSARYDRAAAFQLSEQTAFNTITVSVTVTEGFFNGNPSAWDVTIPDLSGVDGWQNAWGLQTGSPIDWVVTTYYGRPALVLGADPTEGEGVQFAGTRSAAMPVVAARSAGVTARWRRSVVRSR